MIDNFIIIIYLILILYIGYTCRRLGGFREFAVSHGHYGWLVICCTLSASFIGGGFSTGNAAKVFSDGIAYPVALLGFSLQIILVALFIAPRIKSFPGAVSVGDIIEPAYGKKARIITGVFAMLICAGILGAQIGALGAIFNVFFGVSPMIGILVGCGIIFFYSTIGGMPISTISRSPQYPAPGYKIVPTLGNPNVTVISACIADPMSAPVSELNPDGISTEMTGISDSSMMLMTSS